MGGGEKWNVNIARALSGEGVNVHLISRPNSKISQEFKHFTDHIYDLNFGFDFNPLSIWKVYKYIKQHNIETIVGSFTKDISIAGTAGKLAGLGKIVFRNGFPVLQKKWKHKLLVNKFTDIITNSTKIKSQYSSYNWGLENKTHVIYNGFNKPSSIDSLKINKSKPIIMGAGRLTSTKRFDVFLDVCQKVNDEIPIQIFIAGTGEGKSSLEKQAHKLNIDVTFLGHIESILPYLNHVDLFLHCSANEGMPNVVMESMFMGVPVVASNAGATDELIDHGTNGFISEIDNKDQFVTDTLELLRNNDIKETFSKNGKVKVLNDFIFQKNYEKVKLVLFE
jgi:glycosyltransferase involved in cell wall biosynthesis